MRKNTRGKSQLEVRVDSALYRIAPPKLMRSSWCGTCLTAVKTLALVLFFYSCSISLTFYNKWLFKGFKFPLSVTIIHLAVKFIIAVVVRTCLACVTGRNNIVLPWSVYMKRVAPTGFSSVLDIGLSNWSLLYITVSLYTMSKSTSIIFILVFAILFGLQRAHACQIIIVLFIAGGLFMFTYESTQFNAEGFVLVIVASVISGLRWSCAQILTQKEELGLSNPVDTIYHLQPVMILGLMPFAVFVEGVHISSTKLFLGFDDINVFLHTWLKVVIGAVLAFMLAMSEYLLLSRTSSLTLSISGILKEICTLYIASEYSNDTMSLLNFFGMLICLFGIALHVILKAIASKDMSNSRNDALHHGDQEQLLMNDGTANDDEDDEEEIFSAKRMHVTRL
ncbi:solute carrier family 35 member C2-like [Acanthaster planci]|uniref:Solute carrier family 35 member C2-like n=1 Tax=Acanthaster planci TaxID=133434 RepID=A0A8B7ZYB9_ACAPL|nr:solute carrier family 35 member C2-like [Acanthaster planci]XP_022110534.1 solute carrier family 35 member C2-like [Acanthaster planci]XP_022110535.1 solute carrier family 35 member C2-like [Acanthaster planci]XP_022110536.1 solute carrier family 35 member C2-like [Acanthaster planci]XP_022110537.1 solute carrier family 35 member C2-like [Acanthaster planci]XP_022110538.1 solute carrier family 35 member C2-like [Acanthaster planci]XP_022110539.1 solute carrier family 35 member C2-like [Aca